jgi:hypothetical protein
MARYAIQHRNNEGEWELVNDPEWVYDSFGMAWWWITYYCRIMEMGGIAGIDTYHYRVVRITNSEALKIEQQINALSVYDF